MTDTSAPLGSDQPGAGEFFAQLGRTTAAWGRIEGFLCTYFQRLTLMNPIVARRVFYSARSLPGRLDMLKAVLSFVHPQPESVGTFLRVAIKKTGQYAATRNMIAHGEAIFMASPGSPWDRQHLIVQGRESWITEHEAVLTQDQLSIAEENFARLGFCLLVVLSWDGQSIGKSPDKYLPLIRELPNPAHSTRLDPSFLGQFELSEERLHVSR